MRGHLKHLLMCAPMLVVGLVLIAGGAGAGLLIPLLACTVMMAVMMGSMGTTIAVAAQDPSGKAGPGLRAWNELAIALGWLAALVLAVGYVFRRIVLARAYAGYARDGAGRYWDPARARLWASPLRGVYPRRMSRATAAMSSSVSSAGSPSPRPSMMQWRAWSSSRPSATLSSAACTAEICVRTSMQ